MIYIATFKGYVDQLSFDKHTDRYFYDVGMGYFKEEIEAENEEKIFEKINEITKSGNFKLIGVDEKK